MKTKTMEDLYLQELKDLYDGEKQLIKALPKMAKAASSTELKAALEEHLQQTERQAQRLEQIFSRRSEKPAGIKCTGMQGILEEGEGLISEVGQSPLRDAGLIAAVQKVEHYEMAGYGTVCTFARRLGDNHAVELLQQTLNEEKAADQKLSTIAESMVNPQAVHTGVGHA
jgi:ferritin-like metal-binding protein YciE